MKIVVDIPDNVIPLIEQGTHRKDIAKQLNISEYSASFYKHAYSQALVQTLNNESEPILADKESKHLFKSLQKYQDLTRINKAFIRKNLRYENAIEELNHELIKILENFNISKYTKYHEQIDDTACAVITLSDLHINELISIKGNTYDFDVASKRLKKFVERIKQHLSGFNIKKCLIINTGDMLNNDSKYIDKILNQATNRANATFLTVSLIQQFILDLNQNYDVTFGTTVGNEARIFDDVGQSSFVASHNYDFIIHNILELVFKGSKSVHFIKSGDPTELVVNINGNNLLFMHGEILKNITRDVQCARARYSSKGVIIDLVVAGHLHQAYLSDIFVRSSSLCGANDYSEKGLNLDGRASQICLVVYPDKGGIDAVKIDLQHTDDIRQGYSYETSLKDVYNPKSALKFKKEFIHKL